VRISGTAGARRASAYVRAQGAELPLVAARIRPRRDVHGCNACREIGMRKGEAHRHEAAHGVADQPQRLPRVNSRPVVEVAHAIGKRVCGGVRRIAVVAQVE
jgi:hypothetical protein